ncbi:UNVERIFIED_CONTAM: hypothetical protein PYX00_008238 [Menopon gallinae]|uniref:BTB domain-containing protein n=1 Tax=Menopon gallinae TaxID=328185 RepID=A0AAW2HNF4_9NEOP
MCHSEDLMFCRSPPPLSNRVDSLYDNEVESDVEFLVGKEPEVWRFPGHKQILSKANIVFYSMLLGPLAMEKTITIEDVDCRAFDYLLKHLYGKEIKFKSVSTALYTLYAAHKYLCFDLVKLCVDYLQENLTVDNVLEIFKYVNFYTPPLSDRCEPSAPPMDAMPTEPNNIIETACFKAIDLESETDEMYNAMRGLLEKCLRLIDQNADRILLQEAIEDMDEDGLREIVKRDTLRVASEYNVFLALDRWTNRECKRRKLVLNASNRRLALGDLFYEIRFPYLKPEELLRKPVQTGLFSESELKVVSALISKSENLPQIPEDWLPHIDKIRRKRTDHDSKNIALSQKTYLIDSNKRKGELKRSYSFFWRKKNKDCSVENGNRNFRSLSIDSCRSDRKLPSFLIKNGGTDFMNRQKNLFDVLSVVEKETSLSRASSDEYMEVEEGQTKNSRRKRTKRFRGKESMFKVPMDPPPRSLKVQKSWRNGPGPVRRGRWIKYSLADVSDYDLSNEGNTAAALSFLKTLRERKALEAKKKEAEEKVEDNSKHLFKPSSEKEEKSESNEGTTEKKSVFVNSKLIMPEYVVGQSKKVKKNVCKNANREKTKEVHLDHIHFEDDE